MAYRVEVRDRELNRIGTIDTWLQLDFVVRYRQEGTWSLLVKDGTPQAQLLQKAGGVVIWQDGVNTPIFSGVIDSFQKYWTKEQHTDTGSVFVSGKCDNQLAFSRLAFPDPTKPVDQQYKGPAERSIAGKTGDVMWRELNNALGPGALPDRRVPGVDVGTTPGVGPEMKDSVRFDTIGDKLEEWAKARDTGYRFIYNPDRKTIELDVFDPRDLSKEVRFSPELGNLRQFVYTLSAPKATRVIVACQGEGRQRYIWQKVDSAVETEWGFKKEVFVDRRDIPLKTGADGSPELIERKDSEGFDDIGLSPDNTEWESSIATARVQVQIARVRVRDAQAAYDAATTPEDKEAALVELEDAKADLAEAEEDLRVAMLLGKVAAEAHYVNAVRDAADSALKENEKTGNFQIYPIDTPQCTFGVHYFVGDIVTVSVDGVEYSDVVREVVISVDDGGATYDISPKIGEQGTGEPLNLYKTVNEMRAKLRRLEARM